MLSTAKTAADNVMIEGSSKISCIKVPGNQDSHKRTPTPAFKNAFNESPRFTKALNSNKGTPCNDKTDETICEEKLSKLEVKYPQTAKPNGTLIDCSFNVLKKQVSSVRDLYSMLPESADSKQIKVTLIYHFNRV